MASLYLVKVLGLSLAFWSSRNSLKSCSIVLSGLRFFIGSSILEIACAVIHLIQSDREDHVLRPKHFRVFLRTPLRPTCLVACCTSSPYLPDGGRGPAIMADDTIDATSR